MRVVVDSNVWSFAFRRKASNLSAPESIIVEQLRTLISSDQAILIGPIRQEVLTGIRSHAQFHVVRQKLALLPDTPIQSEDYIVAAEFGNRCSANGLAPAAVDLLLCAVAHRLEAPVFSTDNDVQRYSRVLPVEVYS